VGYPIIDLAGHTKDLHWYLRQLEAVLIAGLGDLGIHAERTPGLTGVWTGGRKIASIGVHVKQWVTFHGFALNVTNDLRGFDLIVPCGIRDVVMTSVAAELRHGAPPGLAAKARGAVIDAFGFAFGYAGVDRVAESDLSTGPGADYREMSPEPPATRALHL
jgi:lipoyl(octanoyl) transferase